MVNSLRIGVVKKEDIFNHETSCKWFAFLVLIIRNTSCYFCLICRTSVYLLHPCARLLGFSCLFLGYYVTAHTLFDVAILTANALRFSPLVFLSAEIDLVHREGIYMQLRFKFLQEVTASSGGKAPPLATVPGTTRILSNTRGQYCV